MKPGIFVIAIGIVVISTVIYLVKNFKEVLSFFEKIKKYKIATIIYKILIIVVIFGMIYWIYYMLKNINTSIEFYKFTKENEIVENYYDNKILEEMKFYSEVIKKEYPNQNYKIPYIPEGFSYVEGDWKTGFVIQDDVGNQYVWIPCTNKENLEVEILQRKNFSRNEFISKDICINENYENFILSSLENGGFYISRFEIGIENKNPVSKKNAEIIKNVTKKEAQKIVKQMNKNENLHCELINGYAYDTTLVWLKNTNNIEIDKRKFEEKVYSGRTVYNNIYDFTDNIFEITSEISYENVIIRGFLNYSEESKDDEIFKKYGYESDSLSRISIRENDNYYTVENIMGLRTVLYK